MNEYGMARVSCASPRVTVANPSANAAEIVRVLHELPDSDIVLFPELCVTGYTCADLFGQSTLIEAATRAIEQIATATSGRAGGCYRGACSGRQQPVQLRGRDQ